MNVRRCAGGLLGVTLCFPSAVHGSCFIDGKPRTHHQVLQHLAKRVDSARAVFSGEVTTSTGTRITFNVERIWKGEVGSPDGTIVLGRSSYSFGEGKKYLVFAYGKSSAEMGAPDCSWTAPLGQAGRTLELLASKQPDSS